MNSKNGTILLVEDDESLAQWIIDYLTSHNYKIELVDRGERVSKSVREYSPDLVILDLMLPGMNGLEVCQQLRQAYSKPVLILTACSDEANEIQGLENGADDYLVKPVRPRILLARIEALLRRNNKKFSENNRVIGNLGLDAESKSVYLNNKLTDLSVNDFEVLWLLSSDSGKVITRNELISQIRGFKYDGFDRSIDIRISRLRKKLGDDPDKPYKIKTVRGLGYLFVHDAWA
ncbi:MAG: response regulator [Pseudomonadales bacterium]|nr:response regulator [Pseudomonadales bacterium]